MKMKGINVWCNKKRVFKDKEKIVKTNYNVKLSEAVNIQTNLKPFKMNGSHGFVAKSRDNSKLKMKAGSTNVRTMPTKVSNRDNKIIIKIHDGKKINAISEF